MDRFSRCHGSDGWPERASEAVVGVKLMRSNCLPDLAVVSHAGGFSRNRRGDDAEQLTYSEIIRSLGIADRRGFREATSP